MKDMERSWAESKKLRFMLDDTSETIYREVMYFLFLGVGGAVATGFYTGIHYVWWVGLMSSLMVLGVVWGYPALATLSPLNKVDNYQIHPDGTRHTWECSGGGRGYYDRRVHCPGSYTDGSRNLIRKVRELPAEDRSAFPYDLIAALSNDIEGKRRYEINRGIEAALKEISERNTQRALAMKRAVPTDHILEALSDARSNFKVETDTLKELA